MVTKLNENVLALIWFICKLLHTDDIDIDIFIATLVYMVYTSSILERNKNLKTF